MSTVVVMTEIPDGELREHLTEILGRVEAGEELVITVAGRPVAELHPVRRPVSLAEFLTWPKADRAMLDDIGEPGRDETTDDMKDPSAVIARADALADTSALHRRRSRAAAARRAPGVARRPPTSRWPI